MIEKKIDELWQNVRDEYCLSLEEEIFDTTESPIERLLLLGLLGNFFPYEIEYQNSIENPRGFKGIYCNWNGWRIEPQAVVAPRIRVDFLITKKEYSHLKIVIECDGHNFHEKTKDQAKKDKQRERELVKKGFVVLRYSGSEIFENPEKCYKDLEELLKQQKIK